MKTIIFQSIMLALAAALVEYLDLSLYWLAAFIIGWVLIYIMTPYILVTWSISRRVVTYPTEYPGKYYRVLSSRTFIYSAGVWPFPHIVVFSDNIINKISTPAFIWAIAHEYSHRRRKDVNLLMAIYILLFIALIVLVDDLSFIDGFFWSFVQCLVALYIIRAIRHKMEYIADGYALQRVPEATKEDLEQMFSKLSSNQSRETNEHPSSGKRIEKMFPS